MHKSIGLGLIAAGAIMTSAVGADYINSGPLKGKLPYLWSGPVGDIFTAPVKGIANADGSPAFDTGSNYGLRIGGYLIATGLFLMFAPLAESSEWIFLFAIIVGLAAVVWSLYEG